MVVRLPIFKDDSVSSAHPGAPARERTDDP
jgi:hypothetical protein